MSDLSSFRRCGVGLGEAAFLELLLIYLYTRGDFSVCLGYLEITPEVILLDLCYIVLGAPPVFLSSLVFLSSSVDDCKKLCAPNLLVEVTLVTVL